MEEFFENKEKEIEERGSDKNLEINKNDETLTQSKNKRGRPRVKTSEKLLSKRTLVNRTKNTKNYGFVPRFPRKSRIEENSPPAKIKRTETVDSGDEIIEKEDDEDHERNEVFEEDIEEIASSKIYIDCSQPYYQEKNNEIKRKCKICKANAHGCLKESSHEKSKGDTWLCNDCIELTNMIDKFHPNLYSNLRKTLLNKGIKRKRENTDDEEIEEIMKTSKRKSEENNVKEKHVSFKTSYEIGGITIYNEDITSLDDGKWITDPVIALWFQDIQEEVCVKHPEILFIPPSVTLLLKEGFTDDFNVILDPLNIWQKKYIFMPVNNWKATSKGEGTHWSLLMYTIKENMWYYYDSLKKLNLKEARYLVGRVQDYLRPGSTPKITEAICSQQQNNYDCGVFTMAYTNELVKMITEDSDASGKINKCVFEATYPVITRTRVVKQP